MKKNGLIFALSFVMLLSLAGCGKTAPKTNTIAPKAFTRDQQEIVDLLSSTEQEILIFSYGADETFKNFDVWVEVYKDGELIDPHAGGIGMSGAIDAYNGELAVIINQTPDYQWTFIDKEGGTQIRSISNPVFNPSTMGRAFGPITDPVAIEDGREIILYASVFSDEGIRTFDTKTLEEEPERLKEYPYAHIIKCRFTKE